MRKKITTTAPGPPALTVRLADLEQSEHVTFVRTTVSNWPILSLVAFIDQARNGEDTQVCRLHERAFDAIALLETWTGNRGDAARLRALKAALDAGGVESIFEDYTRMLVALTVSYGIRFATTAAQEGGCAMSDKTVSFTDGTRGPAPEPFDVLSRLHELSGLIQAFKAANSDEMSRDPMDWQACGHIADRAAVICYEAEQAAEIMYERENPRLFPVKARAIKGGAR